MLASFSPLPPCPDSPLQAARTRCAAVVLHSPLLSGVRVINGECSHWPGWLDIFPSIHKIELISSPTLIIHGDKDVVINISHGKMLQQKCRNSAEPLWVEGAGHNDVEVRPIYYQRLKLFLASLGNGRGEVSLPPSSLGMLPPPPVPQLTK